MAGLAPLLPVRVTSGLLRRFPIAMPVPSLDPRPHSTAGAGLRRRELFAFDASGQCVACGLCLPHCPTYRLTRDEAESPRGRIALMRALVHGDLPIGPHLEAHLDRCLDCRACEAVCPSLVPYGRLLDGARAVIEINRPRPWRQRLARWLGLDWLIGHRAHLRFLVRILWLYQVSGMQALLRASGLLRLVGIGALEARLPRLPRPRRWRASYPAYGQQRGRVALFTGCISEAADADTLAATIRVLTRLGYTVQVPATQGCCGALHRHTGEPDKARDLMRANLAAFEPAAVDAILFTASGCGAMLAEYAALVPDEPRARLFSTLVMDASQFLATIDWPPELTPRPLAQRIVVHDPCTLRNVLHRQDPPYALLARIPGANPQPLADNQFCCGAGGLYQITQPALAARLLADKLAHLRAGGADILVTSNIGCALHLAYGIRAAGLAIEVTHPVALLERQLP